MSLLEFQQELRRSRHQRRAAGLDPSAFNALHELTRCFLEYRRDGSARRRANIVRCRVKIKGLGFQALEVLGSLWRGPDTSRDLMSAVDIAVDGLLPRELESEPAFEGKRRPKAAATSFEMRIEGTSKDYRASLSGNTRRKMFGQRRKLQEALGSVSLNTTLDFEERGRLHMLRWGASLLHSGRQEFLMGLLTTLPDGALHVSVLQAGARPVSALLNAVVVGETLCNPQGGFDAGACESVSTARLHWGLLVEEASEMRVVTCIDLLLGSERMDDYKQEIARRGRLATSVQVLRNPMLEVATRLKEMISATGRGTSP